MYGIMIHRGFANFHCIVSEMSNKYKIYVSVNEPHFFSFPFIGEEEPPVIATTKFLMPGICKAELHCHIHTDELQAIDPL